jgi:hypothetical protein
MSEGAPPRALFENMADGSSLELPINPSIVNERLESEDEDIGSIGLSHQIVQYKSTKNLVLTMDIFISDDAILRRGGDSKYTLMQMRAWLMSLQYPVSDRDLGRIGKPRVLFVWPNVWRLMGRVRSVRNTHQQFDNATGRTTRMTCALTFVAESDTRILMSDVQSNGTILSGT